MPRPRLAWIDRLHLWLGSLSGLAILLMILLIVPDILGRKFFNTTIPGASEANVLLLVILVYLGLAGAQARKAHFRVSFLVEALPAGLQRALKILTTLLSLLFIAMVAWLTCRSAWMSTLQGESSFGIVRFPIWPSRIAVALGLVLLGLQLAVDLLRLILDGDDTPGEPR